MRFLLLTFTDLIFLVTIPLGMVVRWVSESQILFLLLIFWYFLGMARISSRAYYANKLRYITKHGLRISWTRQYYFVHLYDVEVETERFLKKIIAHFPGAPSAIRGCIVIFREPVWRQWGDGRRICGEQDYRLISVGWREKLMYTALEHELAHRVLQVCAGDPSEIEAHRIMREIGLM
jgi:hypothetical protein